MSSISLSYNINTAIPVIILVIEQMRNLVSDLLRILLPLFSKPYPLDIIILSPFAIRIEPLIKSSLTYGFNKWSTSLSIALSLIIFVLGLLGLLILGWIDVRLLKAMQIENEISWNLTPPQVEMKAKIDEMYEDFKNEKDTKKD